MTERYSAGAMRAINRMEAEALSLTGPKSAAAIISEETGDLALIEALEQLIIDYQDVPDASDWEAQSVFAAARAALAAARKEG